MELHGMVLKADGSNVLITKSDGDVAVARPDQFQQPLHRA
jgi:hypothetical protein